MKGEQFEDYLASRTESSKKSFAKKIRSTPDKQNVTFCISKETHFARRKSQELVAMSAFGLPKCSRDQYYAGLCCAVKQRHALATL